MPIKLSSALAVRENVVRLFFSDAVNFSQLADSKDSSIVEKYSVTPIAGTKGALDDDARPVRIARVELPTDVEQFVETQLVGSYSIPAMPTPVMHAGSVLLRDGRVAVFGGLTAPGVGSNLLQIFDPATTTWSTLTAPLSLVDPTLLVLADHRVLIVGVDADGTSSVSTSLVWEPTTGAWKSVSAPLNLGSQLFFSINLRPGHAATLLRDGRALALSDDNFALIFDPSIDEWILSSAIGGTLYESVALATLPSGKVVAVGGFDPTGPNAVNEVYTYEPSTGVWTFISLLVHARYASSIQVVAGKVFVIGGFDSAGAPLSTFEHVDDALITSWAAVSFGAGPVAVGAMGCVVLLDQRILVAGGDSNGAGTVTKKSFFIETSGTIAGTAAIDLHTGRAYAQIVVLATGEPFFAGGKTTASITGTGEEFEEFDTASTDSGLVAGVWNTKMGRDTAVAVLAVEGAAVDLVLDRPLTSYPARYAVDVNDVWDAIGEEKTTGQRTISSIYRLLATETRPTPARDFHNPSTHNALLDPVPDPNNPLNLGTFVVDEQGDYASDEGDTGLRKRIIRRLISRKGRTAHAPSYGVGVVDLGKRLALPDVLSSTVTDAEKQIAEEPEIAKVRCALVPSKTPGLAFFVVLGKTKTNAVVRVGVPISFV